MPKSQNHSKKDRAQDDSKPYQRQQAHTTRNVDSQPKQQQRNSSTSQTESVTSAILASISQPPATRPKKTSSGANRPSLLVNNRGRQAEHIQVGPSPDIVHEQLFTTEGADATTVQVKHAEFWRTCLPSEPSIYSSLLVDIGNANDKQITADGSTSASNPIRYRTLCFLTKKTVPIESTDTLPIFNPPLAYPSAPRYTFNCRAGPSIDLTNPADHSRVRHYTIKMMQIMAKDPKFMLSEADMPYLIVPVSHSHTADLDQSPGDSIAWEEVHAFAAADGRMLERDEVADEIRLKAIVDDGLLGYYHTDGSARFQILGLCHDLCPSSKLVSDGGSEYSIISIQPKRWKETLASRGEELWEDQPVFEVETAYDLHQMARPASSLRSHFVVPQLIQICNLSLSTYHSLYALPTLLQGLDNVLVAKALIHEYRLRKVSTPLALQATTLQSAGTDTSYQTLEWYGDSCCSLVAAIYGYYLQTHVNCSILEANVLKRAIVENKRQYLAAKRSGLVDYIRAGEGVNSKVWLPVSIAEGTGKTHCFRPVGFRIGVKGIADIVESVVGAYVLTNGISRIFPTFSRLGFEFGVPVNVKTLKSLRPPDLPAYSNDAVSEEQVALFEKCTSYRFKNQALFTFAITRPGNWEQIQDPLEHALSRLGGAVYLHLLTEWIYANHPDRQEGWLTEATHFYGHTDTIMETITHSSLSRVIGHIPQNGRKTKELKAQERLTDGRVQAREIDPASSNPAETAFKLLFACTLIDSDWSWKRGPRKLFKHTCIAYLASLVLPDLETLHPRQELEKLLREKHCLGLAVHKVKSDTTSSCQITWHGEEIGDAKRDTMPAAVHAASAAALKWYLDAAHTTRRASLCACSW